MALRIQKAGFWVAGSVLWSLPPIAVFAANHTITIFQPTRETTINFTTLANKFGTTANAVIPLLIGLGIVVILWGIFKYISAAGDSEKITEGRKAIIYGLIALFLMLSFWGFVTMLQNTFFS